MTAADVERLARLIHEVNRAFQGEYADDAPSQPWACESEEIRETTRAGVERVLGSPDLTPEEHHAAWCEAKRRDGWVWGPEKDFGKKTHPNLRPYGELPEREQVKDRVFLAVVRELTT